MGSLDKPFEIVRDKRGQFAKGHSANPGGMPGQIEANRSAFSRAMQEVEKEGKKNLFKHAIEQAFTDNVLLAAIIRKFIPDLKAIEVDMKKDTMLSVLLMKYEDFKKQEESTSGQGAEPNHTD